MDNGISIIVPMYNAEKYARRCLDSIINQSFRNFEVIVVNDGSQDDTKTICDNYAREYEYIRIIDMVRNGGVSRARLEGMLKAAGKYISFVDADDWIEEDYLEQLINEIGDADIIVAGICKEWEDDGKKRAFEKNRVETGIYYSAEDRRSLYEKMLFYGYPFEFGILPYMCNKLYKKESLVPLFQKVDKRIFDGEDVAIIYEYLTNSDKIVVSDHCKYHYFMHKDSATFKDRIEAYVNASYLYIHLYNTFCNHPYADCILPQIDQYMRFMVWKKDPAAYLMVNTNAFMFPHYRVPEGSRLAIYGAGKMGAAYYHQVVMSKRYELVAWIDQKPKVYRNGEHTFEQQPPAEIINYKFDYIVIALYDETIRSQVIDSIMGLGISRERIVEPEHIVPGYN